MTRFLPVALIDTLAGVAASPQLSCADPITPAEIKHEGPVDFRKEILPILQKKCLACHNATDAEGELVLESPQTMAKGGSTGPGVVAGKPDESLFFTLAARRDEPVMPPEDNKVGAKPLTPEELGLIKLWIEQGAMGSAGGETDTIKWQPLPAGVNPIYAVAISPDGQWAAAARANQIFLYHVPTKREYGRLTDPAILATGLYKNPGVAHVDLVQSMRFSPDSQLLVSGEYRTVKFWQRKRDSRLQEWTGIDSPIRSLTRSADGSLVALGLENGRIQLVETATGTRKAVLEGIHTGAVMGGSFNKAGDRLVTGGQDKLLVVWDVAAGKPAAKLEAPDAIQSVLFVAEDQQVAVGGTDGVIRSWAVASIPAVGATATGIAATKEYAGHSGAVSSLAAVPSNAGQFVSGGQDGTVRVWDVAGGKQLQQIAHGGPVTQVAVRADGQRLISSSANHTVKLWNGADYKMIAELKRDYRTEVANEDLQRAVAVAKRHVEGANADLKQANERKAAEDKNVAAATESHKKAADELAKKVEAEKKPLADKLAADMALASAQATATKLAEAKKAAEAAVPAADVVIQKAQAELDAAAKSIASVDEAAKQAAEQLAKLRETVAQAEKAAAQAAEKQNAALAEKAAKVKAVAE
ncbi:MAG: c-type cytochrome domain-containing protein, partial [Pirellulaceae bacterium]